MSHTLSVFRKLFIRESLVTFSNIVCYNITCMCSYLLRTIPPPFFSFIYCTIKKYKKCHKCTSGQCDINVYECDKRVCLMKVVSLISKTKPPPLPLSLSYKFSADLILFCVDLLLFVFFLLCSWL